MKDAAFSDGIFSNIVVLRILAHSVQYFCLLLCFSIGTPHLSQTVFAPHQYLCFQLWLCGQYRIAEVFAKQRVGNGLNAYAGFSVIKEQTVSSVIICTQALYQGISFVSLSPRHLREHCYHRFLLLSLLQRQACCSDRNTHRWIA